MEFPGQFSAEINMLGQYSVAKPRHSVVGRPPIIGTVGYHRSDRAIHLIEQIGECRHSAVSIARSE